MQPNSSVHLKNRIRLSNAVSADTSAAPSLTHSPASRSVVSRFGFRWLIRALVVLLILGAGILVAGPVQVLPRQGIGPGFALETSEGQTLTSDSLRGQIVLFALSQVGCDESCASAPTLLSEIEAWVAEQDQTTPITIVSIMSNDDRPYSTLANESVVEPGSTRTILATGESERVERLLTSGFGLESAPVDEAVSDQQLAFTLVDPLGVIRAEYHGATPPVDLLTHDLRTLTEEIAHSTGAMRYLYEATHLFSCGVQ